VVSMGITPAASTVIIEAKTTVSAAFAAAV